jgi:hypothetical protein
MPTVPYRVTRAQAVERLVDAVRADRGHVAGCFIAGTAHGYTIELEYIQRDDGTTRYSTWSDVQGVIATEDRGVTLDFAAELTELRARGIIDRELPEGPGRRTLIALANRDGGVWLELSTPHGQEPRPEGPLGRILDLVFPS